jgi:hypothetical protein
MINKIVKTFENLVDIYCFLFIKRYGYVEKISILSKIFLSIKRLNYNDIL